ncbi:hypothetical protein BDK92_7214 [Micromonospora pisi]|uniref:Uncharacterized protein n=1 Tax=Micromonospora pisi TaxID=589240 RepID=A0A495JUP7_9ACTN|nr:hypothetical protein [Micromonospora pisi]RKR92736.1 hypothetical protein BDK92_7214 [Micromonospora pisi]
MTTEVATPPAVEKPSPAKAPKAQPTADKPTTVLTVPAKPAAVTGANVVAIGGTAAAAAGPVGWAVAAVVAGGAVAGYTVRRAVIRRNAKADGGGTPGVGPLFSGRPPAGGGRNKGSRAGGGASNRAGSGGTSGGRSDRSGGSSRTAAQRAKSAGRSLLDRLGRKPGGDKSPGGGGGRNKRTTGGPASKMSRAAGRAAASAARGLWNAVKAQRTAAAKKKQDRAAAGKKTKPQKAWGWARKITRRVLGKKDQPKPAAKTPTTKPEAPRVTGDKVRRGQAPDATNQNPSKPATNRAARTTERNPLMGNNNAQQSTSPFWAAARQVHATAAQHKPRGMLARRQEAFEMPAALGEIAAGLRLLAQTHTSQEPLEPAYAAAVMQVAATVESAAQASRHLAPAFDALHSVQVRRLLQPKVGEDMWDTVNNKP